VAHNDLSIKQGLLQKRVISGPDHVRTSRGANPVVIRIDAEAAGLEFVRSVYKWTPVSSGCVHHVLSDRGKIVFWI
jgi:hypothetical protein